MYELKNIDGDIKKANKSHIFESARKEFVDYGFQGASLGRIAKRAGLPRPNIYYYFQNKADLYQQLLSEILDEWNTLYAKFNVEDGAKITLSKYIRDKVMYSKKHPEASRIFASEIIHGAPHLKEYFDSEFCDWVKFKVDVIQSWIDQGQMNAVNPYHVLFLIWSATQHYADFNVQILSAMDKKQMVNQDFEEAIGQFMNDNKPIKSFEYERRERRVLKFKIDREGFYDLPDAIIKAKK